MDASIDIHMDGWIHDRKKHWGCPLNLLVSISDSSIHHCCCPSWPTLCGLSPLAQDFKLTWVLMNGTERLHRESEAGSWSQSRMQLSQEITDICTFLEANHSTTWWRLQDTSHSYTPRRPISRFFKEDFVNYFHLLSHTERSARLPVDTQWKFVELKWNFPQFPAVCNWQPPQYPIPVYGSSC